MYIDWDTVCTNVMTGLILGGFGFLIWKIQYRYSKRQDAFKTFNNLLFEYQLLLESLLRGDKNVYTENEIENLRLNLKPAFLNFAHYFRRDKYIKAYDDILSVFNEIRNETNTMTEGETLEYLKKRFRIIRNIRYKIII